MNTKKSLVAALAELQIKIKFVAQPHSGNMHRITYAGVEAFLDPKLNLTEVFEQAKAHRISVQVQKSNAAQQAAEHAARRKAEKEEEVRKANALVRADRATIEDGIIEVAKRLEINVWDKDASPHAKRVAGIASKARSHIEGHRKALVEFIDKLTTNSSYALEWATNMFECAASYKVAMELGGAIAHADANRCDETTEELAARLNDYITKEIVRRAGNVPSSTSVTSNLLENYERAAWADFHPTKCW